MEDAIRSFFIFVVEITGDKGKFKKDKIKNVDIAPSLGEIKMDRSSGLGRPTHLPSHHDWFMTVALRFSFPSRLRGSGGFLPLFLTSIFWFI